jgi:very-short-patch-repair endonuclease
MIAEKLHYHYNTEISRQLRKEQTLAEKLLWERLRNRKFNGIKFKRQHSINSFITGFYCYSNRIIIEVDGSIHNDKGIKEYDNSRQVYLEEIGFKIIRFTNSEIFRDIEKVLLEIGKFCKN